MIKQSKNFHPFNSAVEFGLRSLVMLENAFPMKYDLQRLVFFDYLLVHSQDADGPESIHPATPHRSGEVLIKRKILEQGLLLLMSRHLIVRKYESSGILYIASERATPFLDGLQSRYISQLKNRACWVIDNFKEHSDKDLEQFFFKNLDRWGGEFEKESILKSDIL